MTTTTPPATPPTGTVSLQPAAAVDGWFTPAVPLAVIGAAPAPDVRRLVLRDPLMSEPEYAATVARLGVPEAYHPEMAQRVLTGRVIA